MKFDYHCFAPMRFGMRVPPKTLESKFSSKNVIFKDLTGYNMV